MSLSRLSVPAARSRSSVASSTRRDSRRPPINRQTSSFIDDDYADDNSNAPAINEEISEIKRYEDFTTIDWVQDSLQEQSRRRARRREGAGFWDQEGAFGWRRQVREAYDAGQSWLVVTIVGAAIGLNSAFLNIVTEWLSDIKLGHCNGAFYLNKQFCCWGSESGTQVTYILLPRPLLTFECRLP